MRYFVLLDQFPDPGDSNQIESMRIRYRYTGPFKIIIVSGFILIKIFSGAVRICASNALMQIWIRLTTLWLLRIQIGPHWTNVNIIKFLKVHKHENFFGADFLFVSKLLFPTSNCVFSIRIPFGFDKIWGILRIRKSTVEVSNTGMGV